jgi:hypothetical protein
VRTFANLDRASETRTSRDVRMIRNLAIVFDDRAGVDDDIVANPCGRIDDRAGHDHRTIPDNCVLRNHCARMNRSDELEPGSTRQFVKPFSRFGILYRTEPDERRVYAALMKLVSQAIVAEHENAEHLGIPQALILVQQADDVEPAYRHQNVNDHARVAAGSEPDNLYHTS